MKNSLRSILGPSERGKNTMKIGQAVVLDEFGKVINTGNENTGIFFTYDFTYLQ